MAENLPNIWILGTSFTLALLVLLGINLALTLLHSLQERKGQLWRYFGAIAGVRIPDSFGQVVFFGGLTLSLWAVGLMGIAGTVIWQTPLAFGCLGAIIGCRISDGIFSHVYLDRQGFRPNPGLQSVLLYVLESVVLVIVFFPMIRANFSTVLIGFVIGALAFWSVIPTLRLLGPLVFQKIAPWQKGTPQPQW